MGLGHVSHPVTQTLPCRNRCFGGMSSGALPPPLAMAKSMTILKHKGEISLVVFYVFSVINPNIEMDCIEPV